LDKCYQAADIAARYGVTLGTVYDWIRKGRLGAVRLGKRYYIKERDIELMELSAAGKCVSSLNAG
jgi:excisionase family DNA binding protein